MDEWHVGDPADWGDSVGVPDIPYMGYLEDDEDDDERPPRKSRGQALRDEAWQLRTQGRLYEALDVINQAIEYGVDYDNFNLKAIILEDMGRYHEALIYYDKELELVDSQVVKDNKARLLCRMAKYSSKDDFDALHLINMALNLTGDEYDRCDFLRVKMDILERMGRQREAYVCNKLANGQKNLVDKFERQSGILKNTADTLICISETRFYDGIGPFSEGTVLDLIKEPDNEHDSDAIRVEKDGKTVGYVANSSFTLIDEAKSASEIRDLFENKAKAKVLFIFMEMHIIAKLI